MISRENCMVIYLKKTTETTPIIDEFVCSGRDYLIVRNFFTYQNYMLSLIICKRTFLKKGKIMNEPFTITKLKKYAEQDISFSFPKEMAPLINAIKKVINKQEIKAGDVLSFENPIAFGAQTYADQPSGDFLSMFWGPGPMVGEVTDFAIVGLEIERSF